jgi:hypothetical protein
VDAKELISKPLNNALYNNVFSDSLPHPILSFSLEPDF